MEKRTYLLGITLAALIMMMSACASDETEYLGNWIRRSSFEGVGRSFAVSFVVGEKAYVGLGYDGDDYLLDFWSYDPSENFWKRVSDFPGEGRSAAVAFSIGGKGYVGTGHNGDDELVDFWEYDTETDQWRQLPDFPGEKRYKAVGFAVNEMGYVGTGYSDNYYKDFFQFDPSSETWTQIVSLKGEKRYAGTAFVIGSEAYVGTGTNNGIYETDFWEFDGESIDWARMTDLDDEDLEYEVQRQDAVGFALKGKGYITTGSIGANTLTTWEYVPGVDTWEQKTSFEGAGRIGAVAFTIGNRSYVALGASGSYRFDDIWEFIPGQTYNEDD